MQNSHSDHQMMAMQSNGMKIAGYIEEFTKTSSTQIFQPITKQSFIAIREKKENPIKERIDVTAKGEM